MIDENLLTVIEVYVDTNDKFGDGDDNKVDKPLHSS